MSTTACGVQHSGGAQQDGLGSQVQFTMLTFGSEHSMLWTESRLQLSGYGCPVTSTSQVTSEQTFWRKRAG